MSDSDDDIKPSVIKRPKIHYGSLAESALKILQQIPDSNNQTADSKGVSSQNEGGNIFVSSETIEMDKFVDPHKEAILAEFERRKRAKSLTIPTDDNEVKTMLRMLDEPICLFGEDKGDRRNRLRSLLSTLDEDEAQRILRKEEPKVEKPQMDNATWYHPGDESLRQARLFIAAYSLPKAKQRLDKARLMLAASSSTKAIAVQETHKWIRGLTNQYSQVGDTRPLSHCQFSPNSQMLATAGWSGLCQLWSVPDCTSMRQLRGHTSSCGCVAWHPQATLAGWSPSVVNLATCAHDGSVLLWSLEGEDDQPLDDIEGHQPYRVSKVEFHPSGRFLATCCYDNSWRLFDLEVNEEVLFQEGHCKPVFDISFQCDGSLALTAGLDCYGRVWDLRTGRCVMFLEGHQKPLLSAKFAPDGHRMATASADNTCKIWDLRTRRNIYTVPAHSNLVSSVRFDPGASGVGSQYMVTASYDNTIKLWTNPGWQPLRTLTGHESKVMCVDVSPDGKYIASASYDRTFKLWTPD